MQMKLLTLILFGVTVTFSLFAKEKDKNAKYAHGQVFLLNNDTMSVYIKIEKISQMQNGIQYVDSMGMEFELKPFDAKGFNLIYPDDTIYFESRNDLDRALFQSKKKDWYFVHQALKGKLSLYYFIESKLEMEGLDQILIEKSLYFVWYKNVWYKISEELFKNDFKKFGTVLKRDGFEDKIKTLLTEIIAGEYKFEDTPLLISKFSDLISE
jgi:hypothetical protein